MPDPRENGCTKRARPFFARASGAQLTFPGLESSRGATFCRSSPTNRRPPHQPQVLGADQHGESTHNRGSSCEVLHCSRRAQAGGAAVATRCIAWKRIAAEKAYSVNPFRHAARSFTRKALADTAQLGNLDSGGIK